MNNSYIEMLEKSCPEIQTPLTEERLCQIERIKENPTTVKYIAKSERRGELEKELQMIEGWLESIDKTTKFWKKCRLLDRPVLKLSSVMEQNAPDEAAALRKMKYAKESVLSRFATRFTAAVYTTMDILVAQRERITAEYQIEDKGVTGEAKVESYISQNLDGHVLSGVVLPGVRDREDAPMTAETDLMLVSHHGVYVCEIKNYGRAGQVLDIQANGEIFKCTQDGYLLESLPSPFAQNERHCKAVRKVLAEAGLGDVPVYSAVIIANPDVKIINTHGFHVSNMRVFCTMVRETKGEAVSEAQQEAVLAAINAQRLPERKFAMVSAQPFCDNMQKFANEILEFEEWFFHNESVINDWVEQMECEWRNQYRWYLRYTNRKETLSKSRRLYYLLWILLIAFLGLDGLVRDPIILGSRFMNPVNLTLILAATALVYELLATVIDIGVSLRMTAVGAFLRVTVRRIVLWVSFIIPIIALVFIL